MSLESSATFTIIGGGSTPQETVTLTVLPSVSAPSGMGRLIHPTLGAYDYVVKPDQWVGIDGDIVVPPVWAITRTLTGATAAQWPGSIQDVMCEERWGINQDGLSMPVAMLRALYAMWQNPVDPAVGYVQWYPNYTSSYGYNVLFADMTWGSGGSSTMAAGGAAQSPMVFDDVINYKQEDDTVEGWITQPVTVFLRIVSKI